MSTQNMTTDNLEKLFLEGNALMNSGDFDAAEQCFLAALKIDAQCGEVMANLAYLHEQRSNFIEAEKFYRQALRLLPQTIQIYLNYGVMLVKQKRFADAELIYQTALQIAPETPSTWSNYGVLLACTHRESEAEECYRKALSIDGTYRKARFNLSYILLRQGRYEEGFFCLESRDWQDLFTSYFDFPRWQGESLQGKSIVICFEGGYGDMIQFCRYASELKARGASKVSIICHPALTELLIRINDVDEVYSYELNVDKSGWDFWTPIISLPYFCGTHLNTIPASLPYLSADPDKVAALNTLFSNDKFKVGIVWQGNTLFENNEDRSVAQLETLRPILEVAGIQFVSLQKGAGEVQVREYTGTAPLAGGAVIQNFSDTAALIAHLDLVISVDTSVAHLAGALAKPCWVLLPQYRTDWRWLKYRLDSPWYPEVMRLFRQMPDEDWSAVAHRVALALEIWKAEQLLNLHK
ncbi:tetratricopeptide repeat protein [Undibacterium jejuense]|nr:tetratricopeptide repeat protein [Undibacterium jejuense]